MFSLETIIAMNNEATQKAEEQDLVPYTAKCNGDEGIKTCPKLGDAIPKGWEFVQEFFVDKTGWGSENEPALTYNQLLGKIKKGFGYALGEEGQCQIHVREYKKV